MSQSSKRLKRMAPQVGLEPTTLRLTAECSAIELLRSGETHAGACSVFIIAFLNKLENHSSPTRSNFE
jgi:hypothetical protein